MEINLSLIKTLNPCKNRLDNYTKYYDKRVFTKGQFMGLKNITQEDKLWVAFRLMPKANISLSAADIAESVLHIYENKYPDDLRPRRAIEAARNKNTANAAYVAANAAYAAANAAYAAANAAYAAANAAAYVAANAAYAAANAANAAANAANAAANAAAYVAANAAYAAANAANAAANAANANFSSQQKLIRKIVLKYWK